VKTRKPLIPERCKALLCELIEHSVNEYRELVNHGIISGAEVTKTWPTYVVGGRVRKRRICGMVEQKDAVDLLHFLNGDFLALVLDELDFGFTAAQMRRKLGMGS